VLDLRPLKSSKGKNGELVYHLDSSDDDAANTVDMDGLQELPQSARPKVEYVDLE
jgi:hypothetical protein